MKNIITLCWRLLVNRTKIINSFIKKYNYKTYLEIGVRKSEDNFDKIDIEYKEGVDPKPISGVCDNIMTSDEFFNKNKKKFDIIFIDGLHLEEQVLKDIHNSLYFLNDNGVIVLHDCNPISEFHQREIYEVNGTYPAWNGTTWKAFVKMRMQLLKYDMYTVDTDQGCGVIKTKGKNIPYRKIDILTYNDLDKDRKNMLNLITIDEFKGKL